MYTGSKNLKSGFMWFQTCVKSVIICGAFLHKMKLPEVLAESVEQEKISINLLGCDLKVQV